MSQTKAAAVLQKAWRQQWRFAKTSSLVKSLTREVNTDYLRVAQFEDVRELLSKKEIVDRMKRVVQRLTPLEYREVNPKIVLSAFLMVHKTSDVFGSPMSREEEIVHQAATAFVDDWEHFVTHGGFATRKRACTSLSAFLTCFGEWKKLDAARLRYKIRNMIVTLYGLRVEEQDPERCAILDREIENMREKIKVLVDPKDEFDLEHDGIMSIMTGTKVKKYTNVEIMHEVLIDGPTFTFIGEEVETESFWKELLDEVVQGDTYGKVLLCMSEFRRNVLSIAAACECCVAKYRDIERIESKIRAENALEWNDAKFVLDNMMALCSLEFTLTSQESFVAALRACCEDMAKRRLGAAHAQIRNVVARLAPVQGVAYERIKFQQSGAVVVKTREWLETAMRECTEQREPLSIHAHALVSLIAHDNNVPETLELDKRRIDSMRQYFQAFVEYNILVMTAPSAALDEEMLTKKQVTVPAAMRGIVAKTSDVYKRLSARFFKVVAQRIVVEVDERPVRITPILLSTAIQQDVAAFLDEVRRMAKLNRQVYMTDYYEGMIRSIAAS